MTAIPAEATVPVNDDGLADLYAATYPRLVALLRVACGSAADAEDIAQEAFARLLPRWDKVSRYDNPDAWLRCVAFRIAGARSRRARVAARGLVRLGAPPPVLPPDGARVDAERVLGALPPKLRLVLVLHHGLGLPVDQIARELGIPVGTVKSRLSRARAQAAAAAGADHD